MTTFTLPTSRPITQAWGAEFDDWDGDGKVDYPGGFYHSIGWLGHNGIDYGCFIGDPVEAVCDGVIEYVGPGNSHPLLTGGGNTILLRNDELRIRFEYLHLSQQNVYTGQRVKVGQVIGLSGNSGAATAAHLHLGAIPVGNVNQNDGWRGRVDPTPYLYGVMNPDYPNGIAAMGGTITPIEQEWSDMASEEEIEAAAYRGCLKALEWAIDTDDGKKLSVFGMVGAILPALKRIPRETLTYEFPWYGFDGKQPSTGRKTTTLAINGGYVDAIASMIAQAKSPQVDVQALAAQLAPHLSTAQANEFLVALGKALPKE